MSTSAKDQTTGADTPVLTIVIPSYNVEAYLEHGLSTFADERFGGRLQVLVIDDGSQDATPAIAQRFVERMPDVFILVSKENGGHGSAINVGLAHATGTYFRVVDGDDWVDTDALAAFLDVLDGTDADLLIDVRIDVDMATGHEKPRPHGEGVPLGSVVAFEDICENPVAADSISIHTLTARTALLREVGLNVLEKTFYEDYEYISKATLFARSIEFVDLAVYHYLLGNASQSVADAVFARRWDDHTRVTYEMLRYYVQVQASLSESRRNYLQRKVNLVIDTHYNIALIFDPERKRGLARAKEFRAYLKAKYPEFAQYGERRYKTAKILHHLGVDSQQKLNRIVGRQ